VNIAFIEEWARFAEGVGVDLFEVIDAIRVRPTHSNIRQPGFGVGGYCLTKDPLFARFAAVEHFSRPDLDFPFSHLAVEVNSAMPLASLDRAQSMLDGGLSGKGILLLGVSYRPGIGDTRFSPSQFFLERARNLGAHVSVHDPLVRYWPEVDLEVPVDLPSPQGVDIVVFAVAHEAYRGLDLATWLDGSKLAILDANNVLTAEQRHTLSEAGCRVECIGRGEAAS
ncbi:MAG: nucleotide sugar dehydrogenase, partial [Rhodospirillales bacterium]|nr:nucleotide sugar dehydrogenase [Rhodospirillales bacterium]